MSLRYVLLVISLWAVSYVSANGHAIFHGTSVAIVPSSESRSPADSTLYGANFFCYMSDVGYFSFGWWVPAGLNGDTTHCKPDSRDIHWYEYAEKVSCDEAAGTCEFRTQNFEVKAPGDGAKHPFPPRSLQYVVRPMDLGNGEYGQMALSYVVDDEVRLYGVGTRQMLTGGPKNPDCAKVLKTLRELQKTYKPSLNFSIADICSDDGDDSKPTKEEL